LKILYFVIIRISYVIVREGGRPMLPIFFLEFLSVGPRLASFAVVAVTKAKREDDRK
jgi:hypothetical protein